MAVKGKTNYRWIKDEESGKEFLCPDEEVKSGENVSRSELESGCVDDLTASVNPRGG